MTGGVIFSGGLALTGLVVVLSGVAHWRRWVEPGASVEPGSSAGRMYVFLPMGLALLAAGMLFGFDELFDGLPDAIAGPLIVIAVVGFLMSPVVLIWQPEWLRPAWHRQRAQRFSRRQQAITAGRAQAHHLLVLLTFSDDEGPVGLDDDPVRAEAAARAAIAADTAADVATVLDLDRGAIALTIEREAP